MIPKLLTKLLVSGAVLALLNPAQAQTAEGAAPLPKASAYTHRSIPALEEATRQMRESLEDSMRAVLVNHPGASLATLHQMRADFMEANFQPYLELGVAQRVLDLRKASLEVRVRADNELASEPSALGAEEALQQLNLESLQEEVRSSLAARILASDVSSIIESEKALTEGEGSNQ